MRERWICGVALAGLLVLSGCYSTEISTRRVVAAGTNSSASPAVEGSSGSAAARTDEARPSVRGTVSTGKAGATDTGVSATTIKIGHIGDFTGQSRALYGPELDTLNAYISDLNSRGGIYGRRVELVYYSASYQSSDQVLAAARRLVEQDKVFAVVSQTTLDNANSSAIPYYNEKGVPCLGCRATTQESLALGPFNFEVQIDPPGHGAVIGAFVAKRLEKKRMALGYCPSPWSHRVRDALEAAFEKLGGQVVDERDIGQCDQVLMESTVAAWAAVVPRPDVVVVIDPIGMVEGCAAARRIGWDVQFTGPGGMVQLALDIGGAAIEGLVGTTEGLAPPGYDSPQANRYRQVLHSYFPQHTYDALTLKAWADISLFEEAARRAGANLTRRGVADALNSMTGWQDGLGPPLSYSSGRHWGRTATAFYRVHNQAFERATPEDFLSFEDLKRS